MDHTRFIVAFIIYVIVALLVISACEEVMKEPQIDMSAIPNPLREFLPIIAGLLWPILFFAVLISNSMDKNQ